MNKSKTLLGGIVAGIIVGMLSFDVSVFNPKSEAYLGFEEGYAALGIHFAIIMPVCIGAAFLMKYIDMKTVGGRETWDKKRKFGRITFIAGEIYATVLVLFVVSAVIAAIAAGLEIFPKEKLWMYAFIIMAVYGGAWVVQLLIIRRRNARRFRKTS